MPGVTTARATGRGRSTTPGLTTHPTGYATYWQYTTAVACSVLAAVKPPVSSSADNAIESFILASLSDHCFILMPCIRFSSGGLIEIKVLGRTGASLTAKLGEN